MVFELGPTGQVHRVRHRTRRHLSALPAFHFLSTSEIPYRFPSKSKNTRLAWVSVPWLTRFNESMQGRDPRRIALRRAARAAVVVPLAVVVLTRIPAFSETALFGVFAALALLIFSDFGGTLRHRALAYSATTLAGVPIMIGGSIAGRTIAGAMLMMAAVALLLGLLGVLRGSVAAAQTTLLLATVLATTSSPRDSSITGAAAWLVGGIMATLAAVFLWPAPANTELRSGLGAVLRQVAEVVRLRWSAGDPSEELNPAVTRLDSLLESLHDAYDGDLQRPAGLTSQDRALSDLVEIAGRLRTYQSWGDLTIADSSQSPLWTGANSRLAGAVADDLSQTADLLSGEDVTPSPASLGQARVEHLDSVSDWTADRRTSHRVGAIRSNLDDTFPLRLTSAGAELAAENALLATGRDPREEGGDIMLSQRASRHRRGLWIRLRSQMSMGSPWFRNALRSAAALAVSVGIAKYLGLGHEFWIVLGTLSALRFDALGTGRTVVQAFLGTAVGVLLAMSLIAVVGDQDSVWWVLLPVSLFVAAYTPGTFSLASGQAGFTFAVLVLFSLLFPARIETAELRILDITIGLTISFSIAVLMWPRGVTATLYTRMSDAMSAAADHFVAAVDYACGGAIDTAALVGYSQRSNAAIERARESFDLSVAQRPPRSIPMSDWSNFGNGARLLDIAAQLFPGMKLVVQERGPQRTVPDALVGLMLDTASEVRQRLRQEMLAWLTIHMDVEDRSATSRVTADGARAIGRGMARVPEEAPQNRPALDEQGLPTTPAVDRLRTAIADYMSEPSDWCGTGSDPRPALVSWMADWAAFIEWSSTRLNQEAKERQRSEQLSAKEVLPE